MTNNNAWKGYSMEGCFGASYKSHDTKHRLCFRIGLWKHSNHHQIGGLRRPEFHFLCFEPCVVLNYHVRLLYCVLMRFNSVYTESLIDYGSR